MSGTGIKHYRDRKSMTQAAVASAAGIEVSRMSRIEAGDTIPTAEEVDLLVSILEVPPSNLFSRHILAEVAARAAAR